MGRGCKGKWGGLVVELRRPGKGREGAWVMVFLRIDPQRGNTATATVGQFPIEFQGDEKGPMAESKL